MSRKPQPPVSNALDQAARGNGNGINAYMAMVYGGCFFIELDLDCRLLRANYKLVDML